VRWHWIILVFAVATSSCTCVRPIRANKIDQERICVERDKYVTVGCHEGDSALPAMGCLQNDKTGQAGCTTNLYPGVYQEWTACDMSGELYALCISSDRWCE
jgi:hypothetical protein